MSHNPFQGKRYLNLLRASTDMQDTSPHDQKVVNDRYAESLGMTFAGDVTLQGVSGSKTFNRRDLKDLLERRIVFKNYDVIVVYDSSRLTRGGAKHSFAIRHEFAKLGVVVTSVMDPVPSGDFADVIQSVIDTQNHLYSKKVSGFVTRGIYDAVKNGVVERHGSIPLGIDRLYVDATETPLFRLRYLPGGRRQLLREPDGVVVKEATRGTMPVAAYLLNSGEKSRLVPGDKAALEAIRDAFALRYIQGMGFHRIGHFLVSKGVYPLRASHWSGGSVRDILMNPMYLGWSYCFQHKCGLFHNVAADRPEEREINQAELEALGREEVPRERREVAEMLEVKHPRLTGIITDPGVRAAAEKKIREYYRDWHLKHERAAPFNQNNGATSRYFLRSILRDVHHHRAFHGQTCGRESDQRYYAVSQVIELAPRERPLSSTIRAKPLEDAVLMVLREVFANLPDIKVLVTEYVQQILAEQPNDIQRRKLEQELHELKDRLSVLQRTFSTRELNENESYVRELRSRREELERQLAVAAITILPEPTELVTSICASLAQFDTGTLSPEGCEKLRLLVKTVCPRMIVNLENHEVEMEVALPKNFVNRNAKDWSVMCSTSVGVESNARAAHQRDWLSIAKIWLVPVYDRPNTGKRRPKIRAYEWMPLDDVPPRMAA